MSLAPFVFIWIIYIFIRYNFNFLIYLNKISHLTYKNYYKPFIYTFLDIHLNKQKMQIKFLKLYDEFVFYFKIIINEIKLIGYYLIVWTFSQKNLISIHILSVIFTV